MWVPSDSEYPVIPVRWIYIDIDIDIFALSSDHSVKTQEWEMSRSLQPISALPILSLAYMVWNSGSSQPSQLPPACSCGTSALLRSQKCPTPLGKVSEMEMFPKLCRDSCGMALRSRRNQFIVLLLESKFLGGCQTSRSRKWQCLPWLQPAYSLFPLGLVCLWDST